MPRCVKLKSGLRYEDMTGDYDEAFAALRRVEERQAKEQAKAKEKAKGEEPSAFASAFVSEDRPLVSYDAILGAIRGVAISLILWAGFVLFAHHVLGWF